MITGRVSSRHALIPLLVSGANGQGEGEFVLDTGFTGFLTLPAPAIAALGLVLTNYTPATLADGTTTMMSVYEVTVTWDGVIRSIEVLEADSMPLLGTSLPDGHRVNIDFVDGGIAAIERRLPGIDVDGELT